MGTTCPNMPLYVQGRGWCPYNLVNFVRFKIRLFVWKHTPLKFKSVGIGTGNVGL